MADIWVRGYAPEDAAGCAQVFYDAVHIGAARHYDANARAAWVKEVPNAAEFNAKLSAAITVVADNGSVCGFMSLLQDSVLDMAYVAPDQRRTGTADVMHAQLMNLARVAGHERLTTFASLMAQSFFTRLGWRLIGPDPVIRQGVTLHRTRMDYDLSDIDLYRN